MSMTHASIHAALRRVLSTAALLLALPLAALAAPVVQGPEDKDLSAAQAAERENRGDQLLVLSYHDVRDDVARKGDPDAYAVSTQNFAAHLDW
ncbi:hypothetical protein CATMIT_01813, partial [Catenibacterium mitsuokai DSM 15897]